MMLGLAMSFSPAMGQGHEQPNFLLIVSDDQRPDTFPGTGGKMQVMSAIQRLAQRGTVLPQANCAYPVCVPSRTEMLTGRIFPRAIDHNQTQPPTLPEQLRAAGYVAWHVGKWHMAGKPITRGFTESRALFTESATNPKPPMTYDSHGRAITGYRGWVFQDDAGNEYPELGVGLTPDISERFADAAIELIKRGSPQPFFLHLNFTAPHDPRLMPTGLENKYPPDSLPMPGNFQPMPAIELKTRDENLLPRPLAPQAIKEELSAYYAQIDYMDEQIQRVLDALAESGKADNTVIIYVSDHGLALGSHGLIGKQNLYDHTLLTPCVIAGPGIKQDNVIDAQVYLRDISATILRLSGASIPDAWDGVDLLPLLRGAVAEVHPYVIGYYMDESRTVRTHEWKLILYPKKGLLHLFNIRQDPLEKVNLADDPQYSVIIDDLQAKLQEWSSLHPLPGRRVR